MAVRRIATATVAAVLCAGVAGCGGDASSADPTPTVNASATPTRSATGPAAPVLPELAKRNDAVGAKAFLKYWFAAVTYAMRTGDTAPFMKVSAKDCKTCPGLEKKIKAVYAGGQRIDGGGWKPSGLDVDPRLKPPLYRVAVRLVQDKQTIRSSDGSVVRGEPRQEALFFAGARWVGDRFEMFGLERIDD